jgi:hypothetical protein
LIVFDASALVGAALKADSVPERALLHAEEIDVIALSAAVDAEIAAVLSRPKFAGAIPLPRRERLLEIPRRTAVWFEPAVLRPSSAATMICSCSTHGAVCASCVRRTVSPFPDLATQEETDDPMHRPTSR